MNFGFNEEQDLLRKEARRFLDDRCPIDEVRRVMESDSGYSEELWNEIAELGWLGLMLPEEYGGAGLGWVDFVVILEETGRSLFPSPLLSHTLAAVAIAANGSDEQRKRWLPSLAEGSRKAGAALFEEGDCFGASGTKLRGEVDGDGFLLTGQKRYVAFPEAADLFVVSFRSGAGDDDLMLAIVEADASGVEAKAFPLIDETKRMGNLTLEGVRVGPEQILGSPSDGAGRIERMIDEGALAVTAEMSGAVDEALRITVQYAKDRKQFGEPIGHFQGVKHPLAEMYCDLESFRSLLYYGAWALDNRAQEVPRMASLAKAYATDTFVRVGLDCIQLHGAVGYTVDCDIQLYFKRSKWTRPAYGDADFHYERALALRGV
jgi:alkylation response protein AidB-like acyl-CoA dehydrogenase